MQISMMEFSPADPGLTDKTRLQYGLTYEDDKGRLKEPVRAAVILEEPLQSFVL